MNVRIWFFLVFCFVYLDSCNLCALFGAHDLGDNFVLLEGDHVSDRIIVFCTTPSGCCDAGIPVIPSRANTYGKEYVVAANSDERWIVVRTQTLNSESESFWIVDKNFDLNLDDCGKINCDSIIQSHVLGPLDLNSLQERKKELGIGLKIESL